MRHVHVPPLMPDDVVSFGEDLPHTYHKIPMHPDHTWACIVTYFVPGQSAVRFRRYFGLLFGLPLAVTCFNRCSFFLQAILRRVLRVLGSFYFDDLTVQDWKQSASDCLPCWDTPLQLRNNSSLLRSLISSVYSP